MRQGGEPQGVQIVRQGEPTPFNPLYTPQKPARVDFGIMRLLQQPPNENKPLKHTLSAILLAVLPQYCDNGMGQQFYR